MCEDRSRTLGEARVTSHEMVGVPGVAAHQYSQFPGPGSAGIARDTDVHTIHYDYQRVRMVRDVHEGMGACVHFLVRGLFHYPRKL